MTVYKSFLQRWTKNTHADWSILIMLLIFSCFHLRLLVIGFLHFNLIIQILHMTYILLTVDTWSLVCLTCVVMVTTHYSLLYSSCVMWFPGAEPLAILFVTIIVCVLSIVNCHWNNSLCVIFIFSVLCSVVSWCCSFLVAVSQSVGLSSVPQFCYFVVFQFAYFWVHCLLLYFKST